MRRNEVHSTRHGFASFSPARITLVSCAARGTSDVAYGLLFHSVSTTENEWVSCSAGAQQGDFMPARRSCHEEEFVSKQPSRGFSLIELAVVMLIFGLVMAPGIPSFIKYRRDQELVTAAQNIASQIRLSRATAMVTGRV